MFADSLRYYGRRVIKVKPYIPKANDTARFQNDVCIILTRSPDQTEFTMDWVLDDLFRAVYEARNA